MKVIILILMTSVLSSDLTADTRRVFLGQIDLAGLVPSEMPDQGDHLILESTETPVLDPLRNPLGYLPVLFRDPVAQMLSVGLPITLEVTHLYQTPRPGKFLRVTLWVDTKDLSLIKPLIYHIPIHSQEDLSDYE